MFNRMKFNRSFFNRVRIIIIPPLPNPPIILDNMNLSYREYLTMLQDIEFRMVELGYSEYTMIISFEEEDEIISSEVYYNVNLSYTEIECNTSIKEYIVSLTYVELED